MNTQALLAHAGHYHAENRNDLSMVIMGLALIALAAAVAVGLAALIHRSAAKSKVKPAHKSKK